MVPVMLVCAARLSAYTPVAPPDWAGDPDQVRVLYVFPNATTSPSPDESTIPHGSPAAGIAVGPAGTGWQDPESDAFIGDPENGAWDLGKGPVGSIRVDVPIGAALSGWDRYHVDFQINVVAWVSLSKLPALSIEGYATSSLATNDTTAFPDPWMGTWKNRTWVGCVSNVTEEVITFVISAHPKDGSLIDAVEIYAIGRLAPAELTARGTPVAWYQSYGIGPKTGDDWDDVDDYDSDDDGMLNWQEYVAGTHPYDETSRLVMTFIHVVPGEPPDLEWIGGTSGPSAPYRIESTACLIEPDWRLEGTHDRQDGFNVWTGDKPLEAVRYFRIVATRDPQQ